MALNLNEARGVAEKAIDDDVPLMMWGSPGIGKSSMVDQIGDQRDIPVINKKISQIEPTALAGVPVPRRNLEEKLVKLMSQFQDLDQRQLDNVRDELETQKNVLDWYRPSWLPSRASEPNSSGILFLDELNQAERLQQAAALELILEKRLGDHYLPDGWRVVAAGNREQDDANTRPMGSALRNRMIHIEVEADVNTWSEWAAEHGVPEEVVGFLNFRPDLLVTEEFTGKRAFPSPRTWVFAGELYGVNQDDTLNRTLVESAVGEDAAAEWHTWEQIYQDIDPDDLLNCRETIEDKEASYQYAAVFSVLNHLRNIRKTEDVRQQSAEFLNSLPSEHQTIFTKRVSDDAQLWNSLSKEQAFMDKASEMVDLVA